MRRFPRLPVRTWSGAALALAGAAFCCTQALAAAWFLNDGGTPMTWGHAVLPQGPFSHVELMCEDCLSSCSYAYLDPDTSYVAITAEILDEYIGYDFGAVLLMHNAQPDCQFWVKCSLFVSLGQVVWVGVGSDSVLVTHDGTPPPLSGPMWHHFRFGTMSYSTALEKLMLVIDYRAPSGNTTSTYLYWDGTDRQCNSALYAWKDDSPADLVVCEYDSAAAPVHPSAYWYDVTPAGPRRDFHVQVFDDTLSHYSGWVEPPNWSHALHQVGCNWWVSWYAQNAADTLPRLQTFRFQFTNGSERTWGAWTTTRSGASAPDSLVADRSAKHFTRRDGRGKRVHVPKTPDVGAITPDLPYDPGRFRGDAKFAENPGMVPVVAVSGENDAGLGTCIYQGVGGAMVLSQQLPGVSSEGSDNLAWGDYDGDGWPDLALAGMSDSGPITRIYRSVLGTVEPIPSLLVGLTHASLAWGDYDMDGDLDLFVQGHDGTAPRSFLYRNTGFDFVPEPLAVTAHLHAGSADWADWDGDGDPDLLITGSDGVSRRTVFYRNDFPGPLTDVGNMGLPDVALSDAEWGDYDGDGDLDLAFTGEASPTLRVARVYRNDGGVLTMVADLMSVYRSSCAWADVDLDGDLDVAFCGYTGWGLQAAVYLNTAQGFLDSGVWIPGVREGALAWGDVDGDCDPDLLVVGADWDQKRSQPYRNDRLWVAGVPDGAGGGHGQLPDRLLGFPNPFGPETVIRWTMPAAATASVGIYSATGRLVRTVGPVPLEAGEQEFRWDGLGDDGRPVATGIYFCRVTGPGLCEVGKVALVR